MFKNLFLLFLLFLITACGDKNSAFRYFDKKDIEANSVQFTKKVDILNNGEVEVIFISTYLNKINDEIYNDENESFLVSIFFTNLEEQDINKNDYELLLNKKEATLIEKIEKDDERFKGLMMKNYWGNYYLVKFDTITEGRISLELFDSKSSRAILNFEK